MNSPRVAELYRQHAALFEDVARVERAIADELAGEAAPASAPANVREPRKVPVREPYRPPPREVDHLAKARAKRALTKIITR